MSLLSSTVNDDDDDKENEASQTKNQGGNNNNYKKHWKLLSGSSDDALQQRLSPAGASPDRLTLPLGSSPVLKPSNAKDGRLRDVEPLLAASPNILGNNNNSNGGARSIHQKGSGHPLGAVYCIAYTPPHRFVFSPPR